MSYISEQKKIDKEIDAIIKDCEKNCPRSINTKVARPWTRKLQAIAKVRNREYVKLHPELELEDTLDTSDSPFCNECGRLNESVTSPLYKGQEWCYSGGQHDIACDRLNDGSHGDNSFCDDKDCPVCPIESGEVEE